jgi:hypothetical protein
MDIISHGIWGRLLLDKKKFWLAIAILYLLIAA